MSLDSLHVSEKECLLGADDRTKKFVPKMTKGDIALVYVGKRSATSAGGRIQAFRAVFRITGPSFESDTPLWPINGVFRYRIPARLTHRLDVALAMVRVRIPAESITDSGRSRSAIPACRSRRSEATLGVAYLADFG